MKKRLFAVLLCLCMVAAFLPGTALAEEDPTTDDISSGTQTKGHDTQLDTDAASVTIGDTTTYYGTIEAAWTAATAEDVTEATVTLLESVTLANAVGLVLDGNHTITFQGGSFILHSNNEAEGHTDPRCFSVINGTLNVESGTISSPCLCIDITGGTVNVKGGTVEATEADGLNVLAALVCDGGVTNISDSAKIISRRVGAAVSGTGELKVSGGSITCTDEAKARDVAAIEVQGGKLTVTGGTIGNENSSSGVLMSVSRRNNQPAVYTSGDAVISGGTIKGIRSGLETTNRSEVTISGSANIAAADGVGVMLSALDQWQGGEAVNLPEKKLTISGGTMTGAGDPGSGLYVAGTTPILQGGTFVGGIKIEQGGDDITLAGLLREGCTYFNANSAQIAASELTGQTLDGRITVKKGCPGGHTWDKGVQTKAPTVTEPGEKTFTCTVCGATKKEPIPAVGGGASSSGSSSSGSSSGDSSSSGSSSGGSFSGGSFSGGSFSGSSSAAEAAANPDGSTTTKTEDAATGTVTETTKNTDGSQTVVETKKDGTVTTTETDVDGSKTETVAKPDGSSVTKVEQANGITATVNTDTAGKVKAEVALPRQLVNAAQAGGSALPLPIPEVQATASSDTAPVVTVQTGSDEPVKVLIPTTEANPGTVAVLVKADGTEEIVKASVPTEDGLAVSLPDGAKVKLVDNSKSFADVPADNWAADAVSFSSARELFSGTSENTFSPDEPMTRAMMVMVLARFDGADTTGGSTWYEQGVDWAVSKGISDGSNPNGNVSREQLAVMLWRYAGSPAPAGDLEDFQDAGSVSDYAQDAMRWAVENGILNGNGSGSLLPQGEATRAQVAQMLKNFISAQ